MRPEPNAQVKPNTPSSSAPNPAAPRADADVVLIGAGIMSATLASMLAELQPHWRVVILERATRPATESSASWNNAGTGHSGFCELNYMPDPVDPTGPVDIAERFAVTRQWWNHLIEQGRLDPSFLRSVPHLTVVFGDRDVDYLRRRFHTLSTQAPFADMEYTEELDRIREWAPLVMAGRDTSEPVAATRHHQGTDVDFGALTCGLLAIATSSTGQLLLGNEVRTLDRDPDGRWRIGGRDRLAGRSFTIRSRHVFVGAGGQALHLLQKSGIPEVRHFGVLPVGAAFLRCSDAHLARRHGSKVYGRAAIGAPPMSVPHLDTRIVDGNEYLMFGPYATFSTKLLTAGRPTDFFATVRMDNLRTLSSAAIRNQGLIRYLIGQLLMSRRRKIRTLQQMYPLAEASAWEWIPAGQRAQLVARTADRGGELRQGTEVIIGADGTISGLLGASPGASTAVSTMLDLLHRCFPHEWNGDWQSAIRRVFGVVGEVP